MESTTPDLRIKQVRNVETRFGSSQEHVYKATRRFVGVSVAGTSTRMHSAETRTSQGPLRRAWRTTSLSPTSPNMDRPRNYLSDL